MSMSNGCESSAPDLRAVRVCWLATVPSTLHVFYRPLMRAVRKTGADLCVISADGPELAGFDREGLARTYAIPFSRSISPLADVRALRALRRIMRRERFDIVHSHTPKAGLLGMAAAWRNGIAVRVHTVHGLPLETARGWKRRLLTATERLTCRLARRVCVVSPSLRDRMLELRLCPAGKMTILGDGSACGVDLEQFARTPVVESRARAIRREQGIPQSALVVGYVGWMVADKGVADLVEAFERLGQGRRDLYLLMIGADGGDRDPLPASTWAAIRGNPRIRYLGQVPDPESYYASMQTLVLPSRREGFGLAIAEAGAMEVPAVATRVTGCVDAVVDGQTGLLVPRRDVCSLRRAIGRLVDDRVLRERLGRAACERVRLRFSSDRLVAAHLETYQALMSRA